jgi:hypothetical protein
MSSNLFKQGHISELEQPSSTALPTNPFKEGRVWSFVSERHKFKSLSSPPKFDGKTSGGNNLGSGVTTDDEDDSSPPPALVSSTEKVLNDIIEGTTSYREYIRSECVPENAQWISPLAKNLDEETRRTKSPPGTPLFQELDEEKTLLRATQAKAPPLRVPLDLRLTEEELSCREIEIESTQIEIESTLERLSNVAAVLVEDVGTNEVIDLIQNNLDEDEAREQRDGEDQRSFSEDDETSEDTSFGMTEQDENFLKELEKRFELGLLDTLEDTHMAFRFLLDITEDHGKDELYAPHSFTVGLAHLFFQRTDPFNVMIKNYEEKQDQMMQTQAERFKKQMDYLQSKLKENLREDTLRS